MSVEALTALIVNGPARPEMVTCIPTLNPSATNDPAARMRLVVWVSIAVVVVTVLGMTTCSDVATGVSSVPKAPTVALRFITPLVPHPAHGSVMPSSTQSTLEKLVMVLVVGSLLTWMCCWRPAWYGSPA